MMTLTVAEALAIQDQQIAFYEERYPGLGVHVKAATTAAALDPTVAHDVVAINRHIPRGGKIEKIISENYR
jgi:hypothetical protein